MLFRVMFRGENWHIIIPDSDEDDEEDAVYLDGCWTTAHQSSKLLTGYRGKIKDHTQSENLLDQKRQLRTNQSSDIIQVIENTSRYSSINHTDNIYE